MHKQLTALAKRALAFTLALTLLLALIPAVSLTADARAWKTDADFDVNPDFWNYTTGLEFAADNTDLIYIDDQPYDWYVRFQHSFTDRSISPTITATVVDSNGNEIDSYTNKGTLQANKAHTILDASSFPKLTTDKFGTFTVTLTMDNGGTYMFSMSKTFSRVSSNPIDVSLSSRSNPDKVFTFADPIDLVMNIKKNDGIATAYNAAVTVTKGSTEVLAARGVSLPASTNITLSVKDLVNLPSITTAGTYKVNLTLTDSTGAIKHQSSTDFGVVALENNLTATISSASGSSLTFNNVPDLVVNLTKVDGIAEALNTAITVKDSSGTIVYIDNFETNSANAVVSPDLSSLVATGTFTMTAVVTDDAGNWRATTSANFTRAKVNYGNTTYSITSAPKSVTGSIYADTSTTSSASSTDFSVSIRISNAKLKGNNVYIKAIGTLNGQPFVSPALKQSFGDKTTVTAKFTGKDLGSYGIFEDIYLAVYTADGDLLCQTTETYSFARVLDTSDPGDLSLLNLNDHFTSKKGDATLKIPLMAQTGANMWRASIPWATIEKAEGNYAMVADVKTVMDQTKATGMQALILLAYGNDDIYGTPNPTNSRWLNAYADYCYYVASMMAQYYRDQVVGFEIWNEWNHATMSKVPATYRTGAHYATVVKAASAKIRQVNREYGTNFKVIAGATAGDGYGDSTSNTFIKAMFAASGFFDAIDGVSFHTYSSEETTSWSDQQKGQRKFEYISPAEHDFAARITNYKNLMAQYNAPSDLEVWITETGWTTNEVPDSSIGSTDGKTHITYGADEVDAAGYLVQLYAWALYDGTVDRIFWYDFMNDISNQTGVWGNNLTESNYGLVHNWNNSGDQPLAYSAKAGYVTMCALSSKLGGASNGKQIKINNDKNIFAYQFSKSGGGYITVMWAEGSNKTVNLTLSKDITISDMYGNATTYKAGSVTLTLTGAPIYLEYASGAISFG